MILHFFDPSTYKAKPGGFLCLWGQPDEHRMFQTSQRHTARSCHENKIFFSWNLPIKGGFSWGSANITAGLWAFPHHSFPLQSPFHGTYVQLVSKNVLGICFRAGFNPGFVISASGPDVARGPQQSLGNVCGKFKFPGIYHSRSSFYKHNCEV